MGMMVKGIPLLVLIGLVILMVGGLLHIVGLATPYWHTITSTTTQQKDIPTGHHGLFVRCTNINDDIVDCDGHEKRGFLVATQAMEILALLCGVVCIVVTGIWFFLEITKFTLLLTIVTLLSGFLSGLFGIIGIIIYSAEVHSDDDNQPGIQTERTLGWSFALCTLSSCLAIVSVILISIGIRMAK